MKQTIHYYARWSVLATFSGALAGLAATVFLYLLHEATAYRQNHMVLIYGLPFSGLIIGLLYHFFGRDSARGNNLIIDEIHDPKKTLPLRMAPLVLFGTIVTHLFGGSAGREGTAVQMGATLSDQLSRFLKVEASERKILLTTGAGAGFGAAIGAPWAGVIFGMEVISVGRLRPFAVIENLIASFVAYAVTHLLKAPHSHYAEFSAVPFSAVTFMAVAAAAVCFGLASRLFVIVTHAFESVCVRLIKFAPLRPFVGGLVLILLYQLIDPQIYAGLGIEVIQDKLTSPTGFLMPLYKLLATAITLGSGFKGGEFIPLVFIGTTLGAALSLILPASVQLLSSVGFAAVFGAAANTPVACTVMAIEIFGAPIAPYAIIGCFTSYLVASHKGIYGAQRIHQRKPRLFRHKPTQI